MMKNNSGLKTLKAGKREGNKVERVEREKGRWKKVERRGGGGEKGRWRKVERGGERRWNG